MTVPAGQLVKRDWMLHWLRRGQPVRWVVRDTRSVTGLRAFNANEEPEFEAHLAIWGDTGTLDLYQGSVEASLEREDRGRGGPLPENQLASPADAVEAV